MKKSNKEFVNISQEPATFECLENVFVVIHPRDNDNPISNSGSFVRETELSESTLKDAIALARNFEDRLGGSYIAKLKLSSIPSDINYWASDTDLLMITEKGGVDDTPIIWEKTAKILPMWSRHPKCHHGKIKLMKVEKYLKYDDSFFEKVEAGFFNK